MENVFLKTTLSGSMKKNILKAIELIRPDQDEIGIPGTKTEMLVRKNTPAYERLTKELSPLKYFSIDDEYIYAVCMSFEIILKMFGTEDARGNFLNLCREYYGERVRQEAAEQAQAPVLDSRRAELHTEVMAIIQKLYTRTSSIPPTRKEVGEMIMAYFREEVTNRR